MLELLSLMLYVIVLPFVLMFELVVWIFASFLDLFVIFVPFIMIGGMLYLVLKFFMWLF